MGIASRLKLMSFLQYFIWGSWLVTLGSYMINTLDFTGANVGMVYSSKGLAAIIMPGAARQSKRDTLTTNIGSRL